MLNQKKIILMTRLASFEKNEGRKSAQIGHYFRNDYIGWQVLKSIISATIIYIILVAGFVIYDFENFMVDIYKLNLQEYGKELLIKYLVFVAVFGIITYIVYSYRYAKARKNLRIYARNLNKLAESYRDQDGGN